MVINTEIELPKKPDSKVEVADTFNIDSKITVKAFKEKMPGYPKLITHMFLTKIQRFRY